jgi:hypothetical protein
MVILGVVLLVAAVVVLVDMALTTNGTLDVHVLGWHVGTMGPTRALLLGAAVGVVLTLGVVAILGGQARALRKRRERNRAIKGTTAENRRLAAELEAQKARAHEAEVTRAEETAAERDRADADAYPDESRRGGAEYVLGSKYPHDASTSTPTTPPSPPAGTR